jgi:hypothetical protein
VPVPHGIRKRAPGTTRRPQQTTAPLKRREARASPYSGRRRQCASSNTRCRPPTVLEAPYLPLAIASISSTAEVPHPHRSTVTCFRSKARRASAEETAASLRGVAVDVSAHGGGRAAGAGGAGGRLGGAAGRRAQNSPIEGVSAIRVRQSRAAAASENAGTPAIPNDAGGYSDAGSGWRTPPRSVDWFGQPLVSYQVAQASRLSTMRLAHSGERADAQPASAYWSANSPPSANRLKLSRSSVSSG